MRYALISDIHANLPALQAVQANIVGADYKHCGCRYEDPRQEELSHISYAWTQRHVRPATKKFLAGLPFRIDLLPGGGHQAGSRLVLVHGTATLNTLYWSQDRSDDFCLKMAGQAGLKAGDVIAFGHTHKPWHREVGGIHFVNTGSVGRPKDGDWRAGYVILNLDGIATTVDFVRVEYDIAAAERGIRESDLPDDFAEYLRTGGRPSGTTQSSPTSPAPSSWSSSGRVPPW